MKSDPKDCLYCQNNETLHNLMIEIAPLSVSRVFLFKEQTYRGRCLVAYKDHVNDLFELSDEERNAFMADVARVTRAMDKAFHPEKIKVLRNKLTPLQIVITNDYTCSIFQVAKITKRECGYAPFFVKTIFRLIIDEVCIISTRYSVSFS